MTGAKPTPELDLEALLAAAVQRMAKLDKLAAALALADSRIVRILGHGGWTSVDIKLVVSGDQFDALTTPDVYEQDTAQDDFGQEYPISGSSTLDAVFTAVLPPGIRCDTVEAKVRNEPVGERWRDEFKASVGRGPVNQGNVPGVPAAPYTSSDGLRYRSKSEIKVADELRRRGLIFFPLPAAVIKGRSVREPDFVVLHAGRVAILEIHGEPWHPASRAAEDNAKALPFQLAGAVHLIVDSSEAFNKPSAVIDKLLALLQVQR